MIHPNDGTCPAEVAPGIRPRNLDGFHFDRHGAVWLADDLVGVLVGAKPPPPSPAAPSCGEVSVGTGLGARGGKCA